MYYEFVHRELPDRAVGPKLLRYHGIQPMASFDKGYTFRSRERQVP